jgi:hypothetical protein
MPRKVSTDVFTEFVRSMIRQRVKAGLKRAVEQGKQLGRPRVRPDIERQIQNHLRKGTGILKTAELVGVDTATVQRVRIQILALSTKAPPREETSLLIDAGRPPRGSNGRVYGAGDGTR